MRGGGCGRPASGGLSFSITKSVATTTADRSDGRRVCGGSGTGRRAGGQAGASPSSPARLSHNDPPRGATHGARSTAGG